MAETSPQLGIRATSFGKNENTALAALTSQEPVNTLTVGCKATIFLRSCGQRTGVGVAVLPPELGPLTSGTGKSGSRA